VGEKCRGGPGSEMSQKWWLHAQTDMHISPLPPHHHHLNQLNAVADPIHPGRERGGGEAAPLLPPLLRAHTSMRRVSLCLDRIDEQATVALLSLTAPILFGQESAMSLWEKDQMLSLAKLSNKLAVAKSASRTSAHDQRTKRIENSLTLVSAQRILQEDSELGDEIALNENDILRLAVEKIQSSQDMDEIKRFAICGLSVASAKSPDQFEAMASDASSIWHAVIQVDIDKWQNVANENCMAVGGIEEEELIHIVEGTAFVGVLYDFVTTSGEEMQNVGFGCDHVRNQVMQALGSDELEKVLMLSADVVAAAK
jgi:hypothetical protein